VAYPYDHPFWNKYWPGLVHIQDRCTANGKTAGAVQRENIEISDDLDGKTVAVDIDGKKVPVRIEPQKGFGADPDKVLYGGSLDLYRDKLETWSEGIARQSTAEAVSGQFFELWSQSPQGSFPVAVASDDVLARVGGSSRSVPVGADLAAATLAGGAGTDDFARIQDILDTGTWSRQPDGWWVVVKGKRRIILSTDNAGRLQIADIIF